MHVGLRDVWFDCYGELPAVFLLQLQFSHSTHSCRTHTSTQTNANAHTTPSHPYSHLSFLRACIPVRGVTRTVCLISVRCLVITEIQGHERAEKATPEARDNTQHWFVAISSAMEAAKGVRFQRGRSGLSWTWEEKAHVRLVWHAAADVDQKKEESFIVFYKHGVVKQSNRGTESKVEGTW